MACGQRVLGRFGVTFAAVLGVFAWSLALGAAESFAAPTFSSTSTGNDDYTHWEVATSQGGVDGAFSSFPTTGFVPATAISVSGREWDWIANTTDGSNYRGMFPDWTFFVFRQTFDLTGYDPATARLQFQWAADDSGQVWALRGSWTPKYVLNPSLPVSESSLVPGIWPDGESYVYGPTVELSSGFVPGLNTIYFYVEGNAITDGFSLRTVSFTADLAIPKLACVGFEPPLQGGPVTVQRGRALPLKAQLLDESGVPVTDAGITPPVIQVLLGAAAGGEAPIDVTAQSLSAGQGTAGNQFVFTDEGKWQFNLMTKNYSAAGTYTFSLVSGNGAEYRVDPSCSGVFVIQ